MANVSSRCIQLCVGRSSRRVAAFSRISKLECALVVWSRATLHPECVRIVGCGKSLTRGPPHARTGFEMRHLSIWNLALDLVRFGTQRALWTCAGTSGLRLPIGIRHLSSRSTSESGVPLLEAPRSSAGFWVAIGLCAVRLLPKYWPILSRCAMSLARKFLFPDANLRRYGRD